MSQWTFPPFLFVKIYEPFYRNVPWIKITGKKICACKFLKASSNLFFQKVSGFILLPDVNEINSFSTLSVNLDITLISGGSVFNFCVQESKISLLLKLISVWDSPQLCGLQGSWLVIYLAAKCYLGPFFFQMPTTSPAESKNVLRQLGVAPLPAPLTSVPWSSRMNTSSFRWVLLARSTVGRLTACFKWGWSSWQCLDVTQRCCPSLTLWFQALGILQTSPALWRFYGSVSVLGILLTRGFFNWIAMSG